MPPSTPTASARRLLERMPNALYRKLPAPTVTANLCAGAVEAAALTQRSRPLQDWLDYERHAEHPASLRECLDLAISLYRADHPQSVLPALDQLQFDEAPSIVWAVAKGVLVGLASIDKSLAVHSLDVASLAGRIARRLNLEVKARETIEQIALTHELMRPRFRTVFGSVESMVVDAEVRSAMRTTLGTIDLAEGTYTAPNELETVIPLVWECYAAPTSMISETAMVVRVADAFISLSERRPYRPPFSPQAALDVLRLNHEGRWHTSTVDALIESIQTPNLARSA